MHAVAASVSLRGDSNVHAVATESGPGGYS